MASMRAVATPYPDTADTSAFGREERWGLGVAIAAHVVLVAGLLIFDGQSTPIKPPERIAVTVSDNIALESVSPNPMADPAPSVGAEIGEVTPPAEQVTAPQATPSPLAQPAPAPTPRPSPTPAPKAAPKPTPPKPTPAKPADREPAKSQGSRLGSDFLAGTGGTGSDNDQPAEKAGPEVASSLVSAISRQLRPHWTAPQGVDTDKLVTIVEWQMNRDGSLRGRPVIVSQSGVTDANAAQKGRHAELAIRAIQLAAPFDLPDQYYDSWKRARFSFDRRL
ncbi:hypothetical protein [Croceicoccus mobilis]|uniref:Energy transducer TonB n=1 Tax=Croceicoccus mobilis TaxID=1703339 RepID=A0A916YZ68_9SPHN|nr:hypothetical protein [Croceicoccus mobilis]GGD68308.1 hypothetical protein GCM10010990_17270 [Croceicoccus mobilis]